VNPLRAAVVGAGYLGRFHAEKYQALPGVELVAVVDIDAERARRVAAANQAGALFDHAELAGRVDVASVVVPTQAHYAVASDLLDAGIHVLVEKPLTASVAQGRALIERAAACGRVLQVGHVERFNPVMQCLFEQVDQPDFIETNRVAPFTPRGSDVDVVLDLMIHDIDLVLRLVPVPLVEIEASGSAVLTDQIDVAHAHLRFADGCVASLTASRVAGARVRRIRLFQRNACFIADLAARQLRISRRCGRAEGAAQFQTRGIEVPPIDALGSEIAAFVRAVRQDELPPVSGAEGLRALQIAAVVSERIEQRRGAMH